MNLNLNVKHKTILIFLLSMLAIIIFLLAISYTSVENVIQDDYVKSLKFKSNLVAKEYYNKQNEDRFIVNFDSSLANSLIINERDFIFDLNQYTSKKIADSLNVPISFINDIINNNEAAHQNAAFQFVGKQFN
jgi:hypothetical protein